MSSIDNEAAVLQQTLVEAPPLAIVKDKDNHLCATLSEQLHRLGIGEVVTYTENCPQRFVEQILKDTPVAGVMILGLRDAVLGPIEIADLRKILPLWVIVVIDLIDNAHSAADALAAGADDVLRSPFAASEFEARVALRMRQAGMAEHSTALKSPLIARAQLTPVESEIMRILLTHMGQIVTRNQLSQWLDRAEWLYGDRKFDVHITRIRKKLRAAYGERFIVHTIRAKGYLVEITEDVARD